MVIRDAEGSVLRVMPSTLVVGYWFVETSPKIVKSFTFGLKIMERSMGTCACAEQGSNTATREAKTMRTPGEFILFIVPHAFERAVSRHHTAIKTLARVRLFIRIDDHVHAQLMFRIEQVPLHQ